MGARAPGRYVVISVTDTGVGMTAEIMKRIFEPFFTTKSGGTGLGLSAVKHGIEELGGWVKVYSEPGKGSCFRLYLPAVADEAVVAREREEAPLPSGEGKLILAVDDDALALRVMEKCLQRLGYRVLGAGSGEEALSLFRRHVSRRADYGAALGEAGVRFDSLRETEVAYLDVQRAGQQAVPGAFPARAYQNAQKGRPALPDPLGVCARLRVQHEAAYGPRLRAVRRRFGPLASDPLPT